MLDISNLSQVTNAVTSAYNQFLALDTQSIYEEMDALSDDFETKFVELDEKTKEILGMSGNLIDFEFITSVNAYKAERSETFLTRTLLTGTDLAQISMSLIENMPDMSLDLNQIT